MSASCAPGGGAPECRENLIAGLPAEDKALISHKMRPRSLMRADAVDLPAPVGG
jgi:hypothetical protein